MSERILVTGGAGFIGSALVRLLVASSEAEVLVVDKLTYAGNLDSLAGVADSARFRFLKADICDGPAMAQALADFRPDIVIHLAAESHVDRSIDGPRAFVETNVVGTFVLLQETLAYWRRLAGAARVRFRFHHVSTDEVFGTLGADGAFTEETPYRPRSPYSATKAASDHLVRAWHHTYGLPVVISNCSNNYGPFQFPEKLIPLAILNALAGSPIPVYGRGANIRDWLYVDDHARALFLVARSGKVGETYNIGGDGERTNLAIVETLCDLIDQAAPDPAVGRRRSLIAFVDDRPGHDYRYAMDAAKISGELGWRPVESVESGLAKTVRWYLDNRMWWQRIRADVYRGERLGVGI